ncbi:(Fe-S)-binding protein [Caldimonas thermodepolymerans]|nr:(Fe-S)-binding protein [Caldimonas thermodepolymerans]PPE70413.1 Fe-S oxidoreductase [Caldimonas thermodepolymerans]QPC30321.1 (Fe-S)-binding protein [Caldimonas thermodepolymerans]UZG43084.1 (Fe-S)-binding protein [Caldimonas thermodepolymerans]UZG46750.1 (Fe-S)-binding protein [Caldimonas thermodepolymerans]
MKVGFFITCLVDLMRPRIGLAAIRLIESAGFEVEVPMAQTCCGQPAYNSGDRATAQALARKLLDEFERYDYVVMPSGSCGGMVRTHYHELLADDPELSYRYARLQPKVYELTQFLVEVAGVTDVPGRYDGEVTYHDSCAGLRELGIKQQPRALLQHTGAKLKEMAQCEQCCGFGGTFSVKYGDISAAIADEKCEHIAASGTGAVVLGDLGCMLHLEGRLRRRGDTTTRVIHIAEILAGEA